MLSHSTCTSGHCHLQKATYKKKRAKKRLLILITSHLLGTYSIWTYPLAKEQALFSGLMGVEAITALKEHVMYTYKGVFKLNYMGQIFSLQRQHHYIPSHYLLGGI